MEPMAVDGDDCGSNCKMDVDAFERDMSDEELADEFLKAALADAIAGCASRCVQ